MKTKSIELLNKAVADELSAVHQYMYFHFHCDDQGFDLLANLFKRTAIEEMMHIEMLAERILFLKGEVEMKASHDVSKIHENICKSRRSKKAIFLSNSARFKEVGKSIRKLNRNTKLEMQNSANKSLSAQTLCDL